MSSSTQSLSYEGVCQLHMKISYAPVASVSVVMWLTRLQAARPSCEYVCKARRSGHCPFGTLARPLIEQIPRLVVFGIQQAFSEMEAGVFDAT